MMNYLKTKTTQIQGKENLTKDDTNKVQKNIGMTQQCYNKKLTKDDTHKVSFLNVYIYVNNMFTPRFKRMFTPLFKPMFRPCLHLCVNMFTPIFTHMFTPLFLFMITPM